MLLIDLLRDIGRPSFGGLLIRARMSFHLDDETKDSLEGGSLKRHSSTKLIHLTTFSQSHSARILVPDDDGEEAAFPI